MQTNEEHHKGLEVKGASVDNIADSLTQVSREDIIDRSIAHFHKADATFGQRVADDVTE